MFTSGFGSYACPGDTISCEREGYRIVATIEFDPDTKPMDYDQEGWCFDTKDPDHGEQNAAIIEAWKEDEWFYCGIVLSVYRGDVCLTDHAASLWGIECNYPRLKDKEREAPETNAYLLEAANQMLDEAIAHADEIVNKWFATLVREKAAK